MRNESLSRFEEQIQRLVEGGFARLFAGRLHPREVAVRLAHAMEDHARLNGNGQRRAPDIYTVRLNPRDHEVVLTAEPDLATRLAEGLVDFAQGVGMTLTHVPEVRLLADSGVPEHTIAVAARHAEKIRETTQLLPRMDTKGRGLGTGPRAYLLRNDNEQIPLEKAIVSLGRLRTNDIIFDGAGVSRQHAQIRVRFGRHVLFDLGSTGGTWVNGSQVQEKVLQSGDVISLANTTLIYVTEDVVDAADSPDSAFGDTQAYPSLDH
jgi:hypothetical protein